MTTQPEHPATEDDQDGPGDEIDRLVTWQLNGGEEGLRRRRSQLRESHIAPGRVDPAKVMHESFYRVPHECGGSLGEAMSKQVNDYMEQLVAFLKSADDEDEEEETA